MEDQSTILPSSSSPTQTDPQIKLSSRGPDIIAIVMPRASSFIWTSQQYQTSHLITIPFLPHLASVGIILTLLYSARRVNWWSFHNKLAWTVPSLPADPILTCEGMVRYMLWHLQTLVQSTMHRHMYKVLVSDQYSSLPAEVRHAI